MKVAIHDNGDGFTSRWIQYCHDRSIDCAPVDLFGTDLLQNLAGCTHLLAHPPLYDLKAANFAGAILRSVEQAGIMVFPAVQTFWHFDNKVAQKYLLESIGAPLARTHVFYDREQAIAWLNSAQLPVVFKLKGGAGSQNVKLVRTREQGLSLVCRMFGRGIKPVPSYFNDAKTKLWKARKKGDLLDKLKRFPSVFRRLLQQRRQFPPDRGYIYFQQFVPDNPCDIRITVIGQRAFGFRRFIRPNDFRASGSGNISWDPKAVNPRCIRTALDVSRTLGFQSMAYDFVLDRDGNPIILEMSYAYMPDAVFQCPGFWDADLVFHGGQVWPQDLIIEDLLGGDPPAQGSGPAHPPLVFSNKIS